MTKDMSINSEVINGVELLGYNIEIYNSLVNSLKRSNKTSLMHMTAGGKTYIACALMRNNYKNILILTPKNCIGSEWESNPYIPDNTCIITYQSLLYGLEDKMVDNYDLIIYDEFHHIGASKWQGIVDWLQLNYLDAHHVGLSATPIRYLDNVRSMSEELFDDNLVEGVSLLDAIKEGVITPPVYVAGGYIFNDEKTKNIVTAINRNFMLIPSAKYNKLIKALNEFFNLDGNKKLMANIVKKYIDKYRDTEKVLKFIVFAPNIEQVNRLSETVKDWFSIAYPEKDVRSYIIHSNTPKDELECVIQDFKSIQDSNTINIALSVEMISEGVHYPNVDGVFMLRRTMSPNLYYQQIGRCINPKSTDSAIIFDLMDNYSGVGNIESNCLKFRDSNAKSFINGLLLSNDNESYGVYKDTVYSDIMFHEVSDDEEYGEVEDFTNYIKENYIDEDRVTDNSVYFEDKHSDEITKIRFVDVALDIKVLLEDINNELHFNIDKTIDRLEDRYKDGKSVLLINDDDLLMSLKRRLSRAINEKGILLTENQKARLEKIGLVFGEDGVSDTRLLNIQRTLTLIDRYKEDKDSLTDYEIKKMNNGKVVIRKALNKGSLPKDLIVELEGYGFKKSIPLEESRLVNLYKILHKLREYKDLTKKDKEFLSRMEKIQGDLVGEVKLIYEKINTGKLYYFSLEEAKLVIIQLKEMKRSNGTFVLNDGTKGLLLDFKDNIKEIGIENIDNVYNTDSNILEVTLKELNFSSEYIDKTLKDSNELRWENELKLLEDAYKEHGNLLDVDSNILDIINNLKKRKNNRKYKRLSRYTEFWLSKDLVPLLEKDNIFAKNCKNLRHALDNNTPVYSQVKSNSWFTITRGKVKNNSLNKWEKEAISRYKLEEYFSK